MRVVSLGVILDVCKGEWRRRRRQRKGKFVQKLWKLQNRLVPTRQSCHEAPNVACTTPGTPKTGAMGLGPKLDDSYESCSSSKA